MLRLSLLLVIGLTCCWFSFAAADTPATNAAAPTTLTADPYLAQASITTAVFQSHFCTCTPVIGCAGQPIGFDCAEPPGCCHCAGAIPANRTCVGNL